MELNNAIYFFHTNSKFLEINLNTLSATYTVVLKFCCDEIWRLLECAHDIYI